MVRLALLVVLAQWYSVVDAAAYTYNVKSKNLAEANTIKSYDAFNLEQQGLFDPHAVHGIQTADGGFVLVGKSLESESSTMTEAFALKLKDGAIVWKWASKSTGLDVANAVVQIGSMLLVAGFRVDANGVARRSVTKLEEATGNEVYTADQFGDSLGKHGGLEMISLIGDDLYLAGFTDKPTLEEMSFKSYGNIPAGKAVVMKIPVSAFGAEAPNSAHVTWSNSIPSHTTVKAVRQVGDGTVALLWSDAQSASLITFRTDGTIVWGPQNYAEHGEGTDIQTYEGKVLIIGQGGTSSPKTIAARLTRVDAASGTRDWTKSYSVGGDPALIFHECWGGIPTPDGGYAISCGAGIETCSPFEAGSSLSVKCLAGLGDERPGTYPRGAGNWQSLVFKVDGDGELLWQRIDSYRDSASPALGAQGFNPSVHLTSSAAEWVVNTQDGGLAVITDEVFGVGLLQLNALAANADHTLCNSQKTSAACAAATPTDGGCFFEENFCWFESSETAMAVGVKVEQTTTNTGRRLQLTEDLTEALNLGLNDCLNGANPELNLDTWLVEPATLPEIRYGIFFTTPADLENTEGEEDWRTSTFNNINLYIKTCVSDGTLEGFVNGYLNDFGAPPINLLSFKEASALQRISYGLNGERIFRSDAGSACEGFCGPNTECVDGKCTNGCEVEQPDCCSAQDSCMVKSLSENCVCLFDPFCCDTEWDGQCIDEAQERCGLVCNE